MAEQPKATDSIIL